MNFSHPRLKGGRAIIVDGSSYVRFNDDGKVNFHRDYSDMGEMLYEQLHLLGRIIIAVKKRLGT